jgi:hypothetical protein
MKSTKQLGIWMDHSTAHVMKFENGAIVTNTIESQPEILGDQQIEYKDESHSLNKEQRQLSSYYKELGDAILGNEDVILFGPTEAKSELFNLLKDNHLFDAIKIKVESADKMTESERKIFVREYFK